MGRKAGLTDEELLGVAEFRSSALFSEPEKLALEYAEAICKTPVAVSDQLFARLKEHFSDDQLLELTASIAYENYRARFYHALDVASDSLYVCAWQPSGAKQK